MTRKQMYCRTCFCVLQQNVVTRGTPIYNIFNTLSFVKKLRLCSNTKVRPYDAYPQFVCQKCYEKVLDFYEFQLMCRNSLRTFDEIQGCDNDLEYELTGENNKSSSECYDEKQQHFDDQGEQHVWNANLKGNEGYLANTVCEQNDKMIKNAMYYSDKNKITEDDGRASREDITENDSFVIAPVEMEAVMQEIDVYTTNRYCENFEDDLYILLTQDESEIQQTVHVSEEGQKIDEEIAIAASTKTCEMQRVTRSSAKKQNEQLALESPSDNVKKEIISKPLTNLRYYCTICSKLFRFQHKLDAHNRKDHLGLPAYTCTFENCTGNFNNVIKLQDHLLQQHGVPRVIFKCEKENCDREFPRRASLSLHMSKAHNCLPTQPKYDCETCGKTFSNPNKLREHSFIHKDKSTWLYTCIVEGCGQKCRTWIHMKIHQNRHAGIKNYTCPHCGVSKTTPQELKIHINFHTLERTWPCKHCPKVCKTLANFKRHTQNKHSGLKREFKCSFCDAAFNTVEVMKSHEKLHTSDRPHKCELCGMRFIWAYKLKAHQKSHL